VNGVRYDAVTDMLLKMNPPAYERRELAPNPAAPPFASVPTLGDGWWRARFLHSCSISACRVRFLRPPTAPLAVVAVWL